MKQKLSFYGLGLCVFFGSFLLYSFQNIENVTDQIQQYFLKMQKEYPLEKAYLHLDKHTFTLGEDIWFSAFVTAGSNQIPSPLSKTLYVDLFNGEGILLGQKKIRLEEGRGNGDFRVPEFGNEGIYRIKAYTSWMENFGSDYFFDQEIRVFDAASTSFIPEVDFESITVGSGKVRYNVSMIAADNQGKSLSNQMVNVQIYTDGLQAYSTEITLNAMGEASFSFQIPEKAFSSQWMELTFLENPEYPENRKISLPYAFSLADIQFLPEGGHLVENKKSQVAFIGKYPDGSPVNLTGKIRGLDTEVDFETVFGGMGKFELTPVQGVQYQAIMKDSKTGMERSLPLPKADTKGLIMQVVNNPAAKYVTAFIQGELDQNSLILVSQTRGIINYMISGTLTNGIWGVRIPKQNLITGINQITILTQEGQPLLERLIFFQDDDQLALSVEKFGDIRKREQVRLKINSMFSGVPVPGSFSVSVVDAGQVSPQSESKSHILSHLLLSSDIKGNLYQPGFYFKDKEPETLNALDLVMMTHGWSRFSWDDVLNERYPKIERFIERGINIEGTVFDPEGSKKGLRGGKISAIIGEGMEIIGSEYGENGRFIFMDMDYLDTAQITITAEDLRLKNFVGIKIDDPSPFYESIAPQYPAQINIPKDLFSSFRERSLMQRILDGEKTMELEAVTVEGQTIEKEEEEIRKIYGAGDVSIDPQKILGSVGFTNVFQLIQGRVSGVKVFVSGQSVDVQIRGVGSLNAGTSPLYLLDNMPVDAGTLLLVNPQDVSSVDVFKDPAKAAIFGSQGANGVIAVYTKSGAGTSSALIPGKLITRYGGYAAAKTFYHPKYDTKSVETAINDKRSTLYWNPEVIIGENGTVELSYYNSDIAQKHLLIIEGIDKEGRLARLEKVLE